MAALLTIAPSSCSDELNLSIQDPQTNTQFDANGMLAKIYSSLSITGQQGGSGNSVGNLVRMPFADLLTTE